MQKMPSFLPSNNQLPATTPQAVSTQTEPKETPIPPLPQEDPFWETEPFSANMSDSEEAFSFPVAWMQLILAVLLVALCLLCALFFPAWMDGLGEVVRPLFSTPMAWTGFTEQVAQTMTTVFEVV